MCGFQGGDVEVLDEESVQETTLQASPENGNVDACCEHRGRDLDLHAVEEEAVAQGLVAPVDDGAWAEEVRGYGEGEDLNGDVGRGGQGRDVVEGGKEVSKGRVGKDGEGRDIVDWILLDAVLCPYNKHGVAYSRS